MPHEFGAGQITMGTPPFDAAFVPSSDHPDLLAANIGIDVIGTEQKELSPDGLAWITDVVLRLPKIAEQGRHEITVSHLDMYNESWRDKAAPVMPAGDFRAALGKPKVQLMWTPSEGAKTIEIWFSDLPIFMGHSLFCIFDDQTGEVIDCGMFG